MPESNCRQLSMAAVSAVGDATLVLVNIEQLLPDSNSCWLKHNENLIIPDPSCVMSNFSTIFTSILHALDLVFACMTDQTGNSYWFRAWITGWLKKVCCWFFCGYVNENWEDRYVNKYEQLQRKEALSDIFTWNSFCQYFLCLNILWLKAVSVRTHDQILFRYMLHRALMNTGNSLDFPLANT